MKIISLQAENLKRLVAVNIQPDGNVVEITGKNGAGKTSVLDAIFWALAGKDGIQSMPIRKGEDEAIIKLDLGDLKVARKFKAVENGGYTTSIVVESAEGARFPSPQSMLDALVGSLSFDPLGFVRMKPSEQLETLKRFVPGVDFDAIEKANKADYEERTILNRRAKEARAQADAAPMVHAADMLLPIDETAIVARLEAAGLEAAELEKRKANRESVRLRAGQSEAEVKRLESESDAGFSRIETLKKEIAKEKEAIGAIAEKIERAKEESLELRQRLSGAEPLPEPMDTTAIRREIENARQHNAKAAAQKASAERRVAAMANADAAEKAAKALTKKIGDRNAAKAAAISSAALPVPGIAFEENAVLLDGLPFDQASDAQQLRASIAIAAAMNPKLRVIRVRDGSLLDKDSMSLLAEFAQENDMQVWIETVQSGRPGAIVIEDGMTGALATEAAE